MIIDAGLSWVIRKYWSGETSTRVIFFTKDYGLVNCLCKGGRTPKKQAVLQSFIPLWLSIDERKGYYFARLYELASSPIFLSGQNIFAGLYINELISLAMKPQDPHPELYIAYTNALKLLMNANGRFAIEAILRRFEWTLLKDIGYQISLTHDAHSFDVISDDNYYHFVAGVGFIRSIDGIKGAYIRALAEDRLEDPLVFNVAKKIMRIAIDHALDGKVIKTRELYKS